VKIGIAYQEYSRSGGIERASAELADRTVKTGHEVHYHAVRWEAASGTAIHFHKVRVLSAPHSAELVTFAWNARKALRSSSYDITHSHGSVVGCDVVTAHSCHLAGLHAIDDEADEVEGEISNWGIADRIRLAIERDNYARRKYRKVIAVSQGVKEELMSWYGVPGADIAVIPNGVDLEAFSPAKRAELREHSRARWEFRPEEVVLLFVGNEFRRKGLKFIIDAFGNVPDLPLKLLVVGDENPEPFRKYAMAAGVADRMAFWGKCTDMPAAYGAADIFVLPSEYEAFPLALIEAAASGLPILVTRVHGAVELIRNGENGIFIERNPYSIADNISMLLHNRARVDDMARAARQSAMGYSWDSVAAQTLEVYERVMRER
jgi:UDP-glucose:(heptosyl)LPS alpha-1,3-glucosyltransferase